MPTATELINKERNETQTKRVLTLASYSDIPTLKPVVLASHLEPCEIHDVSLFGVLSNSWVEKGEKIIPKRDGSVIRLKMKVLFPGQILSGVGAISNDGAVYYQHHVKQGQEEVWVVSANAVFEFHGLCPWVSSESQNSLATRVLEIFSEWVDNIRPVVYISS